MPEMVLVIIYIAAVIGFLVCGIIATGRHDSMRTDKLHKLKS
jgi:hypothetical protein